MLITLIFYPHSSVLVSVPFLFDMPHFPADSHAFASLWGKGHVQSRRHAHIFALYDGEAPRALPIDIARRVHLEVAPKEVSALVHQRRASASGAKSTALWRMIDLPSQPVGLTVEFSGAA